jgi:uncharacterized protein (DUF427 family)
MPKAIWKGTTIAEAPDAGVERVEGNVYFPPDSVNQDSLRPSDTHSECPWKGTASYYDVETLPDAAWYYPGPKQAASEIRDHVAFWKGVQVEE